jgi:hypothetical protein
MGGVVVAGASALVSSPVFAAGGSNGSQPGIIQPTVTLIKDPTSNDKAAGTVTIPSRPCPVGTINPAQLSYGISHTGTSLASFTSDVGAYTPAPAPGTSVSRPISLVWSQQTGRSVTVTVSARWVCREANATDFAWSCGTWTFPFTANNGGTVTAGTPTLISTTCPPP